MKLIEKKIALVGGARPNFIKMAPLYRALKKIGADFITVNSGQHFSDNMGRQFLREFGMEIDFDINPRHESLSQQMSDIITGLEKIFSENKIELVIVFGDVNATLMTALTAKKMGLKLAHVEAGLRSKNYVMTEEINRIVTDQLSDYLFATSQEAIDNMTQEYIGGEMFLAGNIMIDNLLYFASGIKKVEERFYFCTLHRPENVDNENILREILGAMEELAKKIKIYLPLHPRTKNSLENFGLMASASKIFHILEPLSYTESLYYQKNAELILTDSGGIQEESSVLGVPCLTLRTDTERPITITHGTNILAGNSKDSILSAYQQVNFGKKVVQIPHWHGQTAEMIIKFFQEHEG
jgi:UDP-N-acetylglucosamine 2-epimerase (non-hydrolysing)